MNTRRREEEIETIEKRGEKKAKVDFDADGMVGQLSIDGSTLPGDKERQTRDSELTGIRCFTRRYRDVTYTQTRANYVSRSAVVRKKRVEEMGGKA
jgi:hypothetical protein